MREGLKRFFLKDNRKYEWKLCGYKERVQEGSELKR